MAQRVRRRRGGSSPRTPPQDRRKRIVERGYDRIAEAYAAKELGTRDAKYLRLLMHRLAPGSRVLDLGCGSGIPVTKALAESHDVVGVDLSARQIDLARKFVPRAMFRRGDMTRVRFPRETFHAICSFHAIIHVPREEHRRLFRRIHAWLKPGGTLLAVLGSEDWVSGRHDRFMGVPMFWSHFGPEASTKLLEDAGFRILRSSIERETFLGEPEAHLYVIAVKAPVGATARP